MEMARGTVSVPGGDKRPECERENERERERRQRDADATKPHRWWLLDILRGVKRR